MLAHPRADLSRHPCDARVQAFEVGAGSGGETWPTGYIQLFQRAEGENGWQTCSLEHISAWNFITPFVLVYAPYALQMEAVEALVLNSLGHPKFAGVELCGQNIAFVLAIPCWTPLACDVWSSRLQPWQCCSFERERKRFERDWN